MKLGQDILIIDDEKDILTQIGGILSDESYQVRYAQGTNDALEAIQQRFPSLVILDVWLKESDMDGLCLLQKLIEIDPTLPVIIMSGHGTLEMAATAIQMGAISFLQKPFQASILLQSVAKALKNKRINTIDENTNERKLLEYAHLQLLPQRSQKLKSTIEHIAPSESHILIYGPHGSFFKALAFKIHSLSKRKLFAALSCRALSETEIEKDLFGSEDNGSVQPSLLEKMHSGTIFIEDIRFLSLTAQEKLLEFIQKQTFRRCGGKTHIRADVRLISSHEGSQKEEEFLHSQLLYDRISTYSLEIPSLISCHESIPTLATHFMELISKEHGRKPLSFTREALERLKNHHFQNNWWELEHITQKLLINNSDVTEKNIHNILSQDNDGYFSFTDLFSLPLKEARERFEYEYFKFQISKYNGSIRKISEATDMERTGLYRKIKGLGIMMNGEQKT